jgi:hypothetical protein
MTYRHLKGVFKRTGTIPTINSFMYEYPKVCLAAALCIEEVGSTDKKLVDKLYFSGKFDSFEVGWEGLEYEEDLNLVEYNQAKRLREELVID